MKSREAAKSPPVSLGHQTPLADEQHHSAGMLGRKPGKNRENTYFTDGEIGGSRKISVPQMTPYLRVQLSILSTCWVLGPELPVPAESRTPLHPCATVEEQGTGHQTARGEGMWLWIPTLTKCHCSPTGKTSQGCSETWGVVLALPACPGIWGGHTPQLHSLGRIPQQTQLSPDFTILISHFLGFL